MNHSKIFLSSLPHLVEQHSSDLAYLQRLAQVPHLTFPHLIALLIPGKKKNSSSRSWDLLSKAIVNMIHIYSKQSQSDAQMTIPQGKNIVCPISNVKN